MHSKAHTSGRTLLNRWSALHRGHLCRQNTTNTRDKHPCPHRVSNLQSQQSSCRKLM